MKYKYTSLSKPGNGKKYNEDFIRVTRINDGVLCVVCDGIGGGYAADQASKICAETVVDHFTKITDKEYLNRIEDSLNTANNKILEQVVSKRSTDAMATTADVFFFNSHIVYWGHIGDSRIYDLKNGKLNLLTKDHSLIQQMLDNGYLSMKAAKNHPNKNVVMNAVGEKNKLEIDLSKIILHPDDKHRFMLCTDGIHDVLQTTEIEKVLKTEDLDKCTDVFDNLIQNEGAPDDYSLIIIEREE